VKDSTPQAVQACHELVLWLILQLDKLPRVRRFTLGECLEAILLEVLELLVEVAYSRWEDKLLPLRRANLRLEVFDTELDRSRTTCRHRRAAAENSDIVFQRGTGQETGCG